MGSRDAASESAGFARQERGPERALIVFRYGECR